MREGKGGERREKKEERGRKEGKEGEMARKRERKEKGSKRHCAMDTVYSDIFCNTKHTIPVMLSALAGETFA